MTLVTIDEFGIAKEINDLILKSGLNPKDWYVGITKDENQRNAKKRGIDLDDSENYVCRNAKSRQSACRIEKYFIVDIGTEGGTPCNGGNHETTFVYAINQKTFGPITESLIMEMSQNI